MDRARKNFENSNVLGQSGPSRSYGLISATEWLSRVGIVSLVAGALSIAGGDRDVKASNSTAKPVEPESLRKPRLPADLRAQIKSRRSLLRRQSEFRLPLEKKSFSALEQTSVPDDCPGTIIPPGSYSAAAPYSASGNTDGANDTVSNYDGGYYYSYAFGPDHIYTFTLTAVGSNPRIGVSSSSGPYSNVVYLLNGLKNSRCPSGNGNYTYSFNTAWADQSGNSQINLDQVPLNVPLHLFVDSYSNPHAYTVKFYDVTVGATVIPPDNDAPLDLNADGKTDFPIVRNTGGQYTWFTRTSNAQFLSNAAWGVEGDVPVSGDFDGDGKDDISVWRPGAQGRFFIINSRDQTIRIEEFGQTGDDPSIVTDYDFDGLDDLAVYRAGAVPGAQSYWYHRPVSGQAGIFSAIPWGEFGDRPVPGYWSPYVPTYVVQRPNGQNGRYLIKWGPWGTDQFDFGQADDILVPGDYDGDNFTDIAVVRPTSDGFLSWNIKPLYGNVFTRTWGVAATDQIVPGDYNGDGRTDLAVWRPGDPGMYYIYDLHTGGIDKIPWGETGDRPVARFNTH